MRAADSNSEFERVEGSSALARSSSRFFLRPLADSKLSHGPGPEWCSKRDGGLIEITSCHALRVCLKVLNKKQLSAEAAEVVDSSRRRTRSSVSLRPYALLCQAVEVRRDNEKLLLLRNCLPKLT